MTSLHDKFTQAKTLSELQPLVGYTKDGETSLLELKSIRDEIKKSNRQECKALLAKEICAFLNSNDGIIIWGADISEGKDELVIKNASSANLVDEFDCILPQMIDPVPTGIETKLIYDEHENNCLLIFVPRGDLAPYRVGDWECADKKRILNRYFMRSGTSSVRIPEAVVRSMYLAQGRLPRVNCSVDVKIIDDHAISLSTTISPDKSAFIKDYYCKSEFALLGSNLELIKVRAETKLWESMSLIFNQTIKSPIYPGESSYTLTTNKVLTHDDQYDRFMFLSGLNGDEVDIEADRAPFRELFHNLYVQPDAFKEIFAIATRVTFACQNVPAKTNIKLFILGNPLLRSEIAELDGPQFSRRQMTAPLENKYDAEIYIPATYSDDFIIDGNIISAGPDKIHIQLSNIDNVLNLLSRTETER